MKVGYLCEPQTGGTFTFFQILQDPLARRGIEWRCICPVTASAFRGSPFEGLPFVDYLDLRGDLQQMARLLVEHIERSHYAIVMTLPGGHLVASNLPPYLPRSVRCAIRVPMMTRGAYAPTRAVAPHANRIYAVSDRIRDDLVRRYRLNSQQVEVIYHGVAVPDGPPVKKRLLARPLRLLYVGRLWDLDKGVFLLADILRELSRCGIDAVLTIVGDGPDRDRLKRRLEKAGVASRVRMVGAVPSAALRPYYEEADIFVMPSRFEGCGFAVLEAMAAGCAPVVSDIRGSLRVLVDGGKSGVLAQPGDARSFAEAIAALVANPSRLASLQQAAWRRVAEHYSVDKMADAYAASFRRLLDEPDRRTYPRLLDDYSIPREMRPTWRTCVPRPVKNWIRARLERFGIST